MASAFRMCRVLTRTSTIVSQIQFRLISANFTKHHGVLSGYGWNKSTNQSNVDNARQMKQFIQPCSEIHTQSRALADFTDVNLQDVIKGLLEQSNIFIDVRRPEELEVTGTIGNSLNIPLGELEEALSLPEDVFKQRYQRDKPVSEDAENIVIFCRSGVRAVTACEIFEKYGYKKTKRFPGSMNEWEETLLGSTAAQRGVKK